MNSSRRILIVDDNRSIHDDFRKILGTPSAAEAALAEAEARMFGLPSATADAAKPFAVDAASQGEEGLRMVERALAEGRPYAMAFVDFRMPPGWDGIETTKRLWQVCPELQIVICTAFADCSWSEVLEDLKPLDRLLILKKPFDSIEVLQLASSLTEKWLLLQETKASLLNLERAHAQIVELNADLERRVRERTAELEAANRELTKVLSEVKELSGLLPICSYCKRVRNDNDYWQSVEGYVTQHSEAKFSHGICPACEEKFLKPELEELARQTGQQP
jgi:CheY-like chemotaxis protein